MSFVDGAFLEVLGPTPETYRAEFVDTATGDVVHAGTIANNHWIRTARQYYTPWEINLYRERDGQLVFTHRMNLMGRRVYIALESKALGDTLAWLPAVEAFRAAHDCEVICSTFMNDLFRGEYPQITFVEPGTVVPDLYALYRLGWFYDSGGAVDLHRNVRDFRTHSLGITASDILGLPFTQTRPRLPADARPRPLPGPYVCIGVHATAQAKYWNHPEGWSAVVEFLAARGYTVVLLSREGPEYMGNHVPSGVVTLPPGPIEDVIRYLRHATLFIGVGSGLSWLSWAAGCRTCLISGFSLPYSEMADCIRIGPPNDACHGCFNRARLDPGNWNWCPDQADTPRMFECTRRIAPDDVITAIRPWLAPPVTGPAGRDGDSPG
jgi:autotransporter strand-loop-strand O-heptosyltransferase